MPRVETSVIVPVTAEVAFAVSQTQGEVRYRWDNFVRRQQLLHGAERPEAGVQTETKSKHGLTMVSEYTSFKPPSQVGMKMVTGPPFFARFAAGWSFKDLGNGTTEATWRYTFKIKPAFLAPIGDRIGRWYLGRDIRKRIAGYAKGCEDPAVLAAIKQ